MNAAASHFEMVCKGGTAVYVEYAVGLENMDNVGVADVSAACVDAPCVDMTTKVSAAAVYSEFNVAAG